MDNRLPARVNRSLEDMLVEQIKYRIFDRYNSPVASLAVRLIDWLMELPPALENVFRQDLDKIQEERKMPYVTSIERLARGEGLCLGIETALRIRFGDKGLHLMPEIRAIHEDEKLLAILKALETAASLDDVRQLWSPAGS